MSLSDEIVRVLAPLRGSTGFFARNLTTGEVAEANAHEVLPTESAAKIFILVHYSMLVRAGSHDPSTRVVVPDDFRVNGTGVLRFLSSGISLSLDDLAWLMTIVSDNVATALLLLELGGPEAVNTTMEDLGLQTARLATFDEMLGGAPFGSSTARDLAEAYAHLGHADREKLARQQDLTGLPRRLNWSPYAVDLGEDSQVRVFNKTGVGPTAFIDAGLFETDSARWIAAAMASQQSHRITPTDDPAQLAFGEIGRTLYESWAGVP